MTIEQVYSDLLLRIQNVEMLYKQVDSHVLNSFMLFWTIVVGVFAIIGVALYFVAQQMTAKGIKKHSSEYQVKVDDCEKRVTMLEIKLRETSEQLQSGIDQRAQITTGSYIGTGTYGSTCRNSLVFSFKPKVVIISTNLPGSTSVVLINSSFYDTNDEYDKHPSIKHSLCVTWEGNGVRWHDTRSAAYQLNEQFVEYHFTVIG